MKVHRKPISIFVMVAFTFMLCFWANQSPASTVPASEKSSAAAPESNEGEDTGFIEQEESAPAVKKGKKFPWLIVALVIVAGGAALYFLVLKKKNYTLTTTVGEGVTGTPVAGSATYKKGTVVNYNYSIQSGYSDFSVTLDGASVAASGTVTMNDNHALAASATKIFVLTVIKGAHVNGSPNSGSHTYPQGTNVSYSYTPASGYSNLEVKVDNVAVADSGVIAMNGNHTLTANLHGANLAVNSTPAGARIYLDNVDSGFTTPHSFFFTTAVTRSVHLRYSCGYKEHKEDVTVALGQTKTINATLVPGIWEEFLIPPSSCWKPYNPSRWNSVTHLYRYSGSPARFDTNFYDHSFSGDYTVSVHMNRQVGGIQYSNSIFLGTSTTSTSASGYLIQYTSDGRYSVYRASNYNFITGGGTVTALKSWTNTSAIVQGLNKFNTIKVKKNGSTYDYYINNSLVTSFTDATYNPGYLALLMYGSNVLTKMQYNNVILTPGSSGIGSVPGLQVDAAPGSNKGKEEVGGLIQK